MNIGKKININGINHWVKMCLKHRSEYPVIVVHGGPGGSNYVFERTPGKKLEQLIDIIYYEQRGCGRSDNPIHNNYGIEVLVNDLNSLIHELGFEKVILLGYSFGAELILEYSLKYPSKVHKLILQAPTDFADMKMMYEIQFEGFKSLDISINELESSDIVKKYDFLWSQVSGSDVNRFLFRDINKAVEVRKLWIESGMINTGLMSSQIFDRKRNGSVLRSSRIIVIPTLILIGKYDKNVGVELARKYSENIVASQLEVFEESGHFPDYEEDLKYVEVVRSFLTS